MRSSVKYRLRRLEKIEQRLSPRQQWPRTLSILEQIDRSRREALAPGEGIVEDWHRDLEGIIWGRERITSARGDEGSGRELSGYLEPVRGDRLQKNIR